MHNIRKNLNVGVWDKIFSCSQLEDRRLTVSLNSGLPGRADGMLVPVFGKNRGSETPTTVPCWQAFEPIFDLGSYSFL